MLPRRHGEAGGGESLREESLGHEVVLDGVVDRGATLGFVLKEEKKELMIG